MLNRLAKFGIYFSVLSAFLFSATIFFVIPASGASITWDGGGGDNNWSTCANWSGDTCPGASDIAIFDGTSTKDATVDASFAGVVVGLQMNSGYTGTITLARSLEVRTSDFIQAAGTFDQADQELIFYGADVTVSGGTFDAGTGTTSMTYTSNTVNINSTISFYNLTVNKAVYNQVVTISTGDTIVVTNTLTLTSGFVNGPGSIDMQGSSTVVGATGSQGTGVVKYQVAGNQTIASSGGYISGILVNKPSDSLSHTGTLKVAAGDFTLQSGTYSLGSETLDLSGADFTISGGTFDSGTGELVFSSGAGVIDINTSLTLYDMTVNKLVYNTSQTISSGDTLIVTNLLTLTSGTLNGPGAVEMRGSNTVVGSTGTIGTAVIKYLEAGDQTISSSGGSISGILVNKPSDTLSHIGTLKVSNGDFVLQAGTYSIGSSTLDLAGADFTISGGTFDKGTGSVVFSGASSTIDVNTSLTLNDVTIQKTVSNTSLTISSGDTLMVTGTLYLTTGKVDTGSIEMQGSSTVVGSAGAIGSAVVKFLEAGDQTITGSGGSMPGILINKPSGTISQSGNLKVEASDFVLQSGAYSLGNSTLTLNGADFTISGGTFNAGTGTVVSSGGSSTIDVDTSVTFYHLQVSKTVGPYTVTISSGDTVTVTGDLTLTIGKLNGPGGIEMQGVTTLINGFSGGTTPITFSGSNNQTYQLTSGDEPDGNVTIDKSGGSLSLLSSLDLDAAGQTLTIAEGTLDLSGFATTVTGALTVQDGGVLEMYGNETITRGSLDLQSGSMVSYTGDGDAGSDSYTLNTLTTSYHHLRINSTDGATDTFAISASPFTVGGNFTLTAGTVTGGSATINVAGNWANTGTFTAGTSTVVLNGTSQTISGSTTFNNLTKSVSSADTLTFTNGTTQTIAGTMALDGDSGQLLSLRSDSAGDQWSIDPQGTRTIEYLDVKDSNNINATVISVAGLNVTNSGNNTNWAFMEVTSVTGQNPQTTAGGKSILINGLYFVSTPTVTVGGSSASVTNFSTTQLTVTAPAKSAGTYDVVVTNPDSSASTCSDCMEYVAPPTVTSIDYTYASTVGSQTRVVSGVGMKVGVGGVIIDPSGTADSVTTTGTSSETTFTTPAHAAGSVVLRVYGDGGTDDNGIYTDTASGFIVYEAAPTFASIDEAYAPTVGSGTRTVTGTNLKVGASGAKVGASTVTTTGTSTSVSFTPPDTTAGAVTVRLYSTNGTDGNGLYVDASNALTYEAKPTINSVSPAADLVTTGGDTVTIEGSGIKVGAVGAVVDPSGTADSVTTTGTSTSATFTTPAHAAGTVVLRVYSPNGTDDNGIYTDYASIIFAVATTPSSEENTSGGIMLPPPPDIDAQLLGAFSCGDKNYLNLILKSSKPFSARLTEAGFSRFTPWTNYETEVQANVLVSSITGKKNVILHRIGNYNTLVTQFFTFEVGSFASCAGENVTPAPGPVVEQHIYHIVPDRSQRHVEQEKMALHLYVRLFKSIPNNGDAWRLHNYLAYGGEINKRSLEKEGRGLVRFVAQEKRLPKSSLDWRIVAVLGYGTD